MRERHEPWRTTPSGRIVLDMQLLAYYLNIGLLATGGLVLAAWLVLIGVRHRWHVVLSFAPRRRGLDLVHIAFVLLGWLVTVQGMEYVGRHLSPPTGVSQAEWQGTAQSPGLWPVVSQTVAKIAAMLVLLITTAVAIDRGLRGFGLMIRHLGRDAAWGLFSYLAVWPLCSGLAHLLVWISGQPPQHVVMNLLHSPQLPKWGPVLLWLSAVVVSPIAEELFFRGALQTVFRGYWDSPWMAIAFSAVAFGLIHMNQPQFVPALALLGLVAGYLYEHTGSLVGPMVLHILFNGRTMIFDLMTRQV